jgi:hypothetical protein
MEPSRHEARSGLIRVIRESLACLVEISIEQAGSPDCSDDPDRPEGIEVSSIHQP